MLNSIFWPGDIVPTDPSEKKEYEAYKEAMIKHWMASQAAGKIAGAVGLSLDYHADNWRTSVDLSGEGHTYSSLVSQLFGWTSKVPNRQINVFIRGDKMHVIQRGNEPHSVDLSNTQHTRPTVHRELVRTIWQSPLGADTTTYQGNTHVKWPIDTDHPRRSGTETFDTPGSEGGTQVTYVNGLITSSTTRYADGSETTITYTYSPDPGSVDDTYGCHLVSQQTVTKNSDGSYSTDDTSYMHPDGTPGYRHSVTESDGCFVSASNEQQDRSAHMSQYYENQQQYEEFDLPPKTYTRNRWSFRSDPNFPIWEGDVTVKSWLQALKELDRSIKEGVTLDVYNYDHIVDFTDRIRFNGNTYYLESNVVKQDYKSLKQSIKMVRWAR